MSIIYKIEELCRFRGFSITELEKQLNYGNGSLRKSSTQTIRSDRVQEIADYFEVTPTYLISDESYNLCPVCSFLYDPLKTDQIEMHKRIHRNYLALKNKIGMLFNFSQSMTKRYFAMDKLKNKDVSEEEKIHEYETLLHCDFAEFAFSKDYVVDIPYSEFIRTEIMKKKYFDLISIPVLTAIALKYNVRLNKEEQPFLDKIQEDDEFMANITNLWDLPQEFRIDVYKAIRHAMRDFADKEYFTHMYGAKPNPFS